MNIKRLVRKEVLALTAYQAKATPCSIKLDANESPYGFPEAAAAAASVATNRYPDPEAGGVKRILSKTLGVAGNRLLQGNGSDELISCLIMTFGGPVLFPVPSFSMYGIIAQSLGQQPVPVPLDAHFDLDLAAMLAAIRRRKPKLTFLSSPNNPTGNCFSAERILKILDASSGIVVVDEAYQPFSSEKGFLPLLDDYPNLVILRTLSKIGLAALRFGYLVASPEIVAEVNKVRLPFNVNSFSQAAAEQALVRRAALRAAVSAIVSERDRVFSRLLSIDGVQPFPTEANFILFRVKNARRVHKGLLSRGVLIRDISDAVPESLRVTVGTQKENNAFLKALEKTLGQAGKRGRR